MNRRDWMKTAGGAAARGGASPLRVSMHVNLITSSNRIALPASVRLRVRGFSVKPSHCVIPAAMLGLALGGNRRVAAAPGGPRA